jgi:hypothetical protein
MPKILSAKARRRNIIAQRANLVEHLATRDDEGSLIREPDDYDLDERKRVGERAGAEWVAQHRGVGFTNRDW